MSGGGRDIRMSGEPKDEDVRAQTGDATVRPEYLCLPAHSAPHSVKDSAFMRSARVAFVSQFVLNVLDRSNHRSVTVCAFVNSDAPRRAG